ncbi:MAG: hypothetical protein L6Q98_07670 [Anaerolineae bacterium]|nr:hypothetical protein [Anaerolineae bacterium]NUQ02471.1 hypothetical protein [Anaerolineae bacterium]
MTRLLFIKLGGSLITNKQVANTYHGSAVASVGSVLRTALDDDPMIRLLIGHGSGSFGHVAAQRYGTMQGVCSLEDWRGFAHVAAAAAELNGLVSATLRAQGMPVWRIQPSASARSTGGEIVDMALQPIRAALEHQLVPLVYGDVSLDDQRGGTIISTETVFFYLARHLPVDEILLLGDVDGVFDQTGAIIPVITPALLPQIEAALGGSAGTDVTGGMAAKVRHMLNLVSTVPRLSIRIMGGNPAQIAAVLTGREAHGTLIRLD